MSDYSELFKNYESRLEKAKELNILGYALQGLNALSDYASNIRRNESVSPSKYIPERIQYIPTSTDKFEKKQDATRRMYLNYFRNIGRPELLPALFQLEDKSIEYANQIAEENRKAKIQTDMANSEIVSKAFQINSANVADANKVNMLLGQQRQAALASNKEALLGSILGGIKSYNKYTDESIKYGILKKISETSPNLFEKIIENLFKV